MGRHLSRRVGSCVHGRDTVGRKAGPTAVNESRRKERLHVYLLFHVYSVTTKYLYFIRYSMSADKNDPRMTAHDVVRDHRPLLEESDVNNATGRL